MLSQSEMFKAFILAITLAALLAIVGYIIPRPDSTAQEMFRIADALVTGALGFFAGRASTSPKDQDGDATK